MTQRKRTTKKATQKKPAPKKAATKASSSSSDAEHFRKVAEDMAAGVGAPRAGTVIPRAPIDTVTHMQQTIIRLAGGVLANSDIAYRSSRPYARLMRKDPDVIGPLLQREMAVSMLEWDIVAEDEADETQVEQADALANGIRRNMRKSHDFLRALADAVWYGPSACMVNYQRDRSGLIVPVNWTPIHSDSIAFDERGNLGVYVGYSFPGPFVIGEVGRVHLFDDRSRRATVLNTWMREGPEYEDPYDARYIYAGRGLRDTLWYMWMVKQTVLQLWVAFCERYAMGIRIGRYPSGNDDARDEMEEILANLIGDVSALIPDFPDMESAAIEILEVDGNNASIFADLINGYLAGQIKELLIGQTATTESTTSGLGSTVATEHAKTFQRLVKYDAKTLADSLTFEFVQVMHEMNFGDTPYRPRWEFKIEDNDTSEFMDGVEKFINAGGTVPEGAVRSRLGIKEPLPGEPVLARQMPGMGDGDQMGLFDDVNEAYSRRLSLGGAV